MSAKTIEGPRADSLRSRLMSRPVWQVGVLATVAGAVATEAYAAIAKAAGVAWEAGSFGAEHAETIPFGGFAVSTLMWCAVGTLVAVVLARKAKDPAGTFVKLAVAATILSLALPLGADDTAVSTKIVLAVAHFIAAGVVIPPLALRLSLVRGAGEAAEGATAPGTAAATS